MQARRDILLLALFAAMPASAQEVPQDLPEQLDQLVAPIALYPDPLLAQLLPAATVPEQLPDAADWADRHRKLSGQALADAARDQPLPWNISVRALLPFPSVLNMMAADMTWTARLGSRFALQQRDLLDAVQRERRTAKEFGYLRSNDLIYMKPGPDIAILPTEAAFIVVPHYDPGIVFAPPRANSVPADAIDFSFGVTVGGFIPFGYNMQKFESIGGFFRPWGWGSSGIGWGQHVVVINGIPWRKS